MRHAATTAFALLVVSTGMAGEPDALAFTSAPEARRLKGKTGIEFAVNRETDVAVYVENARGEIVRHLAAGVLGKNAPAPLKPGLSQSLEWDGNDDDGKPAAGAVRVRVAAGLRAGYAGMAFSEKTGPNHISNVVGMAAGPDGRVYVMDDRTGWLYWPARAVHVFRRDGSYEKTIKPFPANTPLERIGATKAFKNDRGYLNPVIHRTQAMTFYPYEDQPAAQMAFVKDRLYLTVVPCFRTGNYRNRGVTPHLAVIDADGGTPLPSYAGPALGKLAWAQPYLAPSTDGKTLFVTGTGKGAVYNKVAQHDPVVHKVSLATLGPAEVFFGEAGKPGKDNKHLDNPRGLCSDGKGHLLVSDYGNNRVVVLKEADASFVSSFNVEAPTWVGVDPKTAAVYVCSADSLVKFAGWKDAEEVSRIGVAKHVRRGGRWGYFYRSFALDCSGKQPQIWVGCNQDGPALVFCRDLGTKFSDLEPAGFYRSPKHWRPSADPTKRLVGCFTGGTWSGVFHVMEESTGKVKGFKNVRVGGTSLRLGPDGSIYAQTHAMGIMRYDKDGKPKPFASTMDLEEKQHRGRLPDRAGSTGTTAWDRDFYVDRKNEIYVKIRGTSYHGLMHVSVYGQDGKKKRDVIGCVSDGSYGPRVDPAGNMYMMECVKPLGKLFPDELRPHAAEKHITWWYNWIYGSIVKFGPEGGAVWFPTKRKNDAPRIGVMKLPDSMKKQEVYGTFRSMGKTFLQGAKWMHPGVAHCGDMGVMGGGDHCHCTGCDFDIDEFGRSFAPDNGRQRVTVIDSAGNTILHFGAYGNQDCCGPDSYVQDPDGKFLRPRKPSDPKDLVSPFAKPEVAFNFIIGLAVTDRYAYVADCANRRVLRAKLEYAAEETCAVK